MSIGTSIPREAGSVHQGAFDVVVVGAGVQGVFCALEATHRGLRTLIVDAGDFGAATSFNSLRTLHGGLRYLQSLDFARARSSYAQQQWWLEHFPELIERRACLMPIHARRLRGRTAFRIARLLAHLSGMRIVDMVREDLRLSAMQTYTYGVKIVWNATDTLQFDAAYERYDMRGNDGVTPQSAYCRANIFTVGAKFSW